MEIAGNTAIWTRPDSGDSPVSYPAPTYSAVKGIFESVLWGACGFGSSCAGGALRSTAISFPTLRITAAAAEPDSYKEGEQLPDVRNCPD